MKRLFSILILIALTGCASIQTAMVCTETGRELIQQEDARLVESRKKIEAWEAGKPIGGMVYSSLSNEQMVSEYKRGYNIAFDRNKYHADQFNRLCTASK